MQRSLVTEMGSYCESDADCSQHVRGEVVPARPKPQQVPHRDPRLPQRIPIQRGSFACQGR